MKTIKLKVILDEEKDFNKFVKAVSDLKEDIHFIFEVEEELESKSKK